MKEKYPHLYNLWCHNMLNIVATGDGIGHKFCDWLTEEYTDIDKAEASAGIKVAINAEAAAKRSNA